MIEWKKYGGLFGRHEFDAPGHPGSGDRMQRKHMDLLYKARLEAGTPFIIKSGIRMTSTGSSHETGWASDIACTSSVLRMKIVKALLSVGFNRIGVYDKHIHADNDPSKAKNVMWWGESR